VALSITNPIRNIRFRYAYAPCDVRYSVDPDTPGADGMLRQNGITSGGSGGGAYGFRGSRSGPVRGQRRGSSHQRSHKAWHGTGLCAHQFGSAGRG
jgi:hypothetical protein